MEASQHPPSGLWTANQLKQLYYGPGSVEKNLLNALPPDGAKAFVVTTSSLVNKTSIVKEVEKTLGSQHAGTFSKISAHAPVQQLDEAGAIISKDDSINTVISIGGGSPIDSAKALSFRFNEKHGRYLYHISIPTTLSAAECTFFAGYTDESGLKKMTGSPECGASVILYDAKFLLDTPSWLLLSTAIRALDHAVETMYHPYATEFPAKQSCLSAAGILFKNLPKYKQDPSDVEVITNLQLASFASLGMLGMNLKGGLGLSHSLGYAMGSPYGIPHGITSCMSLGHVVKLKAEDPRNAEQLARLAPAIGISSSGNNRKDANLVGDAVLKLVRDLELSKTLSEYNVGQDQAGIITKRATGAENGQLYDQVLGIVKSVL